MHRVISWFLVIFSYSVLAQNTSINYITKTVAISDSIRIENVSINPNRFSIMLKNNVVLDSSWYSINFKKALLTFKKPIHADSITINYQNYPNFLTQTYRLFDKSVILESNPNYKRLQPLASNTLRYKPFDGLNTSGSISRGITVGNNQNSVLNSALDIQVSGKLNNKVTVRASIQDANLPLQESGYSQRLDDFDNVFIELFSDYWKIHAGDIDLENNTSYFSKFTKRVQGLNVNAIVQKEPSKIDFFASGALVRGQFTTSQFTAQEGNQGPYKLQGNNGELLVLIVSGSETVYVNGIALTRGENEDYTIDYNAGEIIFNPTFPITSEMRVTVDYQYSERNYSRLVAYGGTRYKSNTLQLGVSLYSENDSKNNPLQQNLSTEQVAILAKAGDDTSLMVAPSAVEETYNENRILYKKTLINGVEAFVFSTNPEDTLFNVYFSKVPENTGHYIVANATAISTIYEYTPPIDGIPQGNYAPIRTLIAPTKLQVAVINSTYTPTHNTAITMELSSSKNDLNLFSAIDDNNNNGIASRLSVTQNILKNDSVWHIKGTAHVDYIQKEFRNIEGLYSPEFNRDWNLGAQPSSTIITQLSNQLLYASGLTWQHLNLGNIHYNFEHLDLSQAFKGNKHTIHTQLSFGPLQFKSTSSLLKSNAIVATSRFSRTDNTLQYNYNRFRLGGRFSAENNQEQEKKTLNLTNLSQRFTAYEGFVGLGDTTKVFTQLGYTFRVNDSLRNASLQRVNTSNTYYIDSKLIENKRTNLGIYINYRTLDHVLEDNNDETSLTSRLQFRQSLFKGFTLWNTLFETNSGTLPRQDFSYVAVEPGQGTYMWIDYNANNIQELNEFEPAQFKDQGTYIRVLKPNQIFIKTHEFKLSQVLTVHPQQWINATQNGKRLLSRFHNQSSLIIDRKKERQNTVFSFFNAVAPLGHQFNFRNVLFFNRGKQRYTTSYTYLKSSTRHILSIGYIENIAESHHININHAIKKTWLLQCIGTIENSKSDNENFTFKNFKIDTYRFFPKLSYLLNDTTRFDIFYQYTTKDNYLTAIDYLKQDKYGVSFSFIPQKTTAQSTINGEFSFYNNIFKGNANSPIGFQLLEGLQPGKNITWSLLAQQKLTTYLDLNLNYFGRTNETSKTVHTGSVELKAYF